jgi:hypothetical protein
VVPQRSGVAVDSRNHGVAMHMRTRSPLQDHCQGTLGLEVPIEGGIVKAFITESDGKGLRSQ